MESKTLERSARDKNGNLVPLGHNHPLVAATFQTWVVHIPSQYEFQDLLAPEFWRNVELVLQARTGRPAPNDLIRCIAVGGEYDAFLVVQEVNRGYTLRFSHGRLPQGTAD